MKRAGKYIDLQELTPSALRELVKAAYVEAPDKTGNGMTEAMPSL